LKEQREEINKEEVLKNVKDHDHDIHFIPKETDNKNDKE